MPFRMTEPYDIILKAKAVYDRMAKAEAPQDFRRIFSESIQAHGLDEFYNVVVRAEICAALAAAARQQQAATADFDFAVFLKGFYALEPQHLVGLDIRMMADIIDTTPEDVLGMLQCLGYSVESNVVAGHPRYAPHVAKVVSMQDRKKASGDV